MDQKYKIPDEILDDIPPYFYAAFAGELYAVFGPTIFDRTGTDGMPMIFNFEGTTGWGAAFRPVASRLELSWLTDYYDTLDWFDSDLFDDQLCGLLFKKFIAEADPSMTSPYYLYLIRDKNGGCHGCHGTQA